MRIGLVTFWKSNDNYGQVLQSYALYKYIEELGHQCFLIRYNDCYTPNIISKFFTLLQLLRTPKRILGLFRRSTRLSVKQCVSGDRKFMAFRLSHMEQSDILSSEQLMENALHADGYVCGSDQIWGSPDPIMYLQFAHKGEKKVAYAPSFGGYYPNYYTRMLIRKYIKDFDFLSCRENSGVELCKQLGRPDTVKFADPTLMHDAKFYSSIAKVPDLKENYIFLYMLGNETKFDMFRVYEFAKKENLKIVFVTGQHLANDEYQSTTPTIEEWIGYIKYSKYVVTNSFHGTVFSLIFHKKFMTIPLSGEFERMNDRIFDLLEPIHMTGRIYIDTIECIRETINFEHFDTYQEEARTFVKKHINSVL
ncbi:MAG: polysaccharide pyruvyl transferase family protein [bacterium]|nr:polysaccharide pyruvyl transferase family protein [bacterium]